MFFPILFLSIGIATGSVYCDSALKSFSIGECVADNTTLVIKTHQWYNKHKYTKAVILVRSPFKVYGSCFDLDITGDHKGVATKKQYDSMCDFKPLIWKKYVWQNISAISICAVDNCIVFENWRVWIVDLMVKNFYFHFFCYWRDFGGCSKRTSVTINDWRRFVGHFLP